MPLNYCFQSCLKSVGFFLIHTWTSEIRTMEVMIMYYLTEYWLQYNNFKCLLLFPWLGNRFTTLCCYYDVVCYDYLNSRSRNFQNPYIILFLDVVISCSTCILGIVFLLKRLILLSCQNIFAFINQWSSLLSCLFCWFASVPRWFIVKHLSV